MRGLDAKKCADAIIKVMTEGQSVPEAAKEVSKFYWEKILTEIFKHILENLEI